MELVERRERRKSMDLIGVEEKTAKVRASQDWRE